MFHLESFWYRPNEARDEEDGTDLSESLLVWIQSEAPDVDDRAGILRKMVKNIRWLAKKLETKQVILHSFAHLGDSKSES
ncbi:MAG: threonyl-tRNA synthetase editing domain-containing protein, partial [Candidatus Thorarchaeota archaeon]